MTVSDRAVIHWRLAPGVVRLRDGRFAGGAPFRVVRLSDRGLRELDAVLGTADTLTPGSSAAALIAKLTGYGIVLAPARPAVPVADVTVVIPALSTAAAIREVLARIPDGVPVVVVDDGSVPALAPGLSERPGSPEGRARRGRPGRPDLKVIRHDTPRGPAAARNAGVRAADTRWVLFLDADVLPDPDWLGVLLAHAGEPDVVAVAPRVVSLPQPGGAGLMERWSGALDLGGTAADVGPGRPVSFVPTAVLLVDVKVFSQVGGFAEELHVGEDVDLVWRMGKVGRVRYEPDVICRHRPRATLGAVLRRRFDYGTSAAALERRHPGTLRHADVSLWSFAPWLIGVAVHPVAGAVAAAGTAAVAPWGMREIPPRDAVELAVRGHFLAAAGIGRYLVRPLWPVTLAVAVALPSRRKVLAGAVLIGTADMIRRWVAVDRLEPARATADRQDQADGKSVATDSSLGGAAGEVMAGAREVTAVREMMVPAGEMALAIGEVVAAASKVVVAAALDDAAYSLGVWAGCRRERNWKALLPRIRDLPAVLFRVFPTLQAVGPAQSRTPN